MKIQSIASAVLRSWASFIAAGEGSAAIVTALAMPVVVGGAAFGVETSYWYYKDLRLQAAADAASYAAALEQRSGSESEKVVAAASKVAEEDGYEPGDGTIEVNSPPLTGANIDEKAVEVLLKENKKRFFTSLFITEPVTIAARGVSRYEDAGSACILALHPSASKAALFSGNSAGKFVNCTVMANSLAGDAVTVQGTASLQTSCILTTGGVSLTSGVTLDDCTEAKTEVSPVADPFKGLAQPSTAGACNNGNGSALQPGLYCNGLTLAGTKTLNAGTYVITGGDLKINANADITGTGVTIFLSGSARVSINGNATVKLSAPTAGAYSGMLFFGDRSSSGGSKNNFNGTAASKLTGAIYFASQAIQYLGNFSGDGGCTQVVGLTVEWSGNATVAQDCSAHGMKKIPDTQIVKLVE